MKKKTKAKPKVDPVKKYLLQYETDKKSYAALVQKTGGFPSGLKPRNEEKKAWEEQSNAYDEWANKE